MKKKGRDDLNKFVADLQAQIRAEESLVFSEKAIREFENPKNIGVLEDADGVAKVTGYCGDTMEIYLKIKAKRINNISFMTDGCGATIACGSMLTSLVKGKTLGYAKKLTKARLIDALDGLPKENEHCAKLTIDTLLEAIKNLRNIED
jgi:nitrogen fixation NifU-like protein